MRPSEAATFIGMTVAQVRQACRKGLIPAVKRNLDNGDPNAYVWDISKKDAVYYKRNRPRSGPKRKDER